MTRFKTGGGQGVHTTPNPRGKGWVNNVGGEILSKHQEKGNAKERGREIAKRAGVDHLVHKRDGTIGEKNSYGHHPHPPHNKNR